MFPSCPEGSRVVDRKRQMRGVRVMNEEGCIRIAFRFPNWFPMSLKFCHRVFKLLKYSLHKMPRVLELLLNPFLLFILRTLKFIFLGFVCSIIFLLIESKWFCGTVWLGEGNLHCICVFAWRQCKKNENRKQKTEMKIIYNEFYLLARFPFTAPFYWGHIAVLSLCFL